MGPIRKSIKSFDWKQNVGKAVGTAAAAYIKGAMEGYMKNKGQQLVGYTNSTAGNTRFNDMGDRGGVVSKTYRKRKRGKRLSRRKRRKIKRFKRAVRKVFKTKQAISCLQEFWPTQFTISATTVDTFGSTMGGNVQCVFGNAAPWGINLGENCASGLTENQYIATEIGAYRARINSVDVVQFDNDMRDYTNYWVQRKYLKLTIRNTNTEKDLIFDLYECVAAQNIADQNYANPVVAWGTIQNVLQPLATDTANPGEPFIKGTEPTDCPTFGRYWKIIKKEAVRIPAASNVVNPYQTFQMWSPKFFYRGAKFNNMWAVKGITKYYMIILDPEQSATASRYGGTDPVCAIIAHRNTHYKPVNALNQLNAAINTPNWIKLNLTTPSL